MPELLQVLTAELDRRLPDLVGGVGERASHAIDHGDAELGHLLAEVASEQQAC
jgi:hypothetical protein